MFEVEAPAESQRLLPPLQDAELAVADVGIRALGLMPLPTDRKNQGLRDVAVQIQGVTVRPGEWLVADEDGIVVMSAPV